MYCKACGANNAPDLKVCTICGLELESSGTTLNLGPLKEETTKINIPVKPSKKPQLVVVKGPNMGMHFALESETNEIGRDPESNIFLNDVTVSRRHAVIMQEASDYSLKDIGSLNGTYVNGERKDSYVLKDGDELQIGKFRLLFVKAF